MVEYRTGDLLSSDATVICHQVNCQGVMGAGLAKQVRTKYPAVYTKYHWVCNHYDRYTLLGMVQLVEIAPKRYVANVFGQYKYGTEKRHTDYEALRCALSKLGKKFAGSTIALPYNMGCNLGGGDWQTVLSIIEDTLRDCQVYIYKKGVKQ